MVAVIAMRMMEMITDEVVDVVSMGNRLVPASRAVNVTGLVARALMTGGASGGIGFRDLD
jgi:hypothetical protein